MTFAPKGINSQAASSSYQHIVIEENSDETKITCDVCQYEDDFDDDEILICNLCQVGVHQTCYGSELISTSFDTLMEKDWYCARCRDILQYPGPEVDTVTCYFCPSVQGALKPIQYCGEQVWAHISCVNWLVNIWFIDEEKERVTGQLKNSPKSKRFKCSHCNKAGGLFNCDAYKCNRKYHVRCAVKIGTIYSYEQMNEDYKTEDDPEGKNVYCNQHRLNMLEKTRKRNASKF